LEEVDFVSIVKILGKCGRLATLSQLCLKTQWQ